MRYPSRAEVSRAINHRILNEWDYYYCWLDCAKENGYWV